MIQRRDVSTGDGWQQRIRRARIRAELTREEWIDRATEWRESMSQMSAQQALQNFSLNDLLERWHARLKSSNVDFDTWFNAQWPLFQQRARKRAEDIKKRLNEGDAGPASLDLPAAVLIGVGIGSVTQGFLLPGVVLTCCGAARSLGRYAVGRVDNCDVDALFRYAPEKFRKRRVELFNRLANEISAFRKYKTFADFARDHDLHNLDHHEQRAMDPKHDYTPEKLYDDAMKVAIAHPRVVAELGSDIEAQAEPDKVVYRIHEGITEIFLGWRVAGSKNEAEVQVKSTACLLDFVYIFPESTGKYGMKPDGFCIRPADPEWSQNEKDWSKYQKKPFGAHNGKVYTNREGVFDYDYEVREFRHGWEEGKAKYAKKWSS